MRALALVAFVACSPYSISGPTTPSTAVFGPARVDVGTICVIRSSPWARLVTFVVHDNRTLVGATKGDSYFCYEAEAGEHLIVSDTFDSTDVPGHTRVVIDPGARYWLRQDHTNNFGSVTSRLEWIDAGTAAALTTTGSSYRLLTAVPGHEQVPPPVPFAPAALPQRAAR